MKKELFGSKRRIAGTLASVLVGLIWIAALTAPDEQAATASSGSTSAISQSPVEEAPIAEEASGETAGQENARRSAESYLDTAAFSRSGLIKQLEFEGYSTADATYGVDAVSPDWNEQAAKSAASYLDMSGFSRSGLIQQLEFEGYTAEQATYGVSQAGL